LGDLHQNEKKKEKGEVMDYEDDFDDDNKEDKLSVTSYESQKLSSDAKEVKKLIREKGHDGFDDDFSDDEDKEFAGVDDLLEKKEKKEPKSGDKRSAEAQTTPGNTKKARTDAANGTGAPAGISEKEVEKQIRDFLNITGKVPLSKLINKFRTTISAIGKPAFVNLMKRITEAKKEDGQTLIYLKDDQYRDFR